MKNNIITVMKKEFTRFFTDRRMVLTTLLLPGLMIYVMYSFMGSALTSQYESPEDYIPTVYAQNVPDSVLEMAESGMPFSFEILENEQEKEDALEKVKNAEDNYELVAVFPKDFESQVAAYDVTAGGEAPAVSFYYNSTSSKSQSAYNVIRESMDAYESAMANKFDVNPGSEKYDLATDEDTTAQMFSMMVPMLMMIFLFSGCMAVAPESIAGEKERGTIATLLVTPMNRGHLALGKIISLSLIAILSGCSSFLGTMLSLPKLMSGAGELDASVYGIMDYIMLLLIILSTVLVIVTMVSIVSAFAKNVKEATGWVTPIMIISMLIGITSMIDSLSKTEPVWYLIPLYNSVQCMNGVFSLNMNMTNIMVAVVSNICYAGVGVFVLTKMFNSEKIMFSK